MGWRTDGQSDQQVKEEEHVPGSVKWVHLCNPSGQTNWNWRSGNAVWNPLQGIRVVWVGTPDEEGDLCWHKVTRASELLCLLFSWLMGLGALVF